MARWPNDTLTVLPINSAPKQADPRFARWAKEKDLWLYGYWHWDWADAYEKVAFGFYLAMAWIPIMWAGSIMFGSLPPLGFGLLAAGGIAYSTGVIFYLWRSG